MARENNSDESPENPGLEKQDYSGTSASSLFKNGEGLSYSDFTILDTSFTDIDKEDISFEANLGKGIVLKTPIIAAPMDTVTNSDLCIAIALEGGIGVIHYNHKKENGERDFDEQIREIERVKRFENGFIEDPITVSPNHTIQEVLRIGMENKVGNSVIDTFPVTEDGSPHGKLVGLLRKQDYSRSSHLSMTVSERMIPLSKLIHGKKPITLKEANALLWEEHLLYLPIVNEKGNLASLVTRSDLDKNEQYPLATKDDKKRLRVLFAVDTRFDRTPEMLERAFAAGADGVVVDTSQGYTKYAEKMLMFIAEEYPNKLLMGGNISTGQAAMHLHDLHVVDCFRAGQGSGSICTTAGTIGVSRASASGIYSCAQQLADEGSKMRTIADGGIKEAGDIVKALAVGADAVMLGNILAGTDESPGNIKINPRTGLPYKDYRGMGSAEANVGGIRGYGKMPQGVSGKVEYKGSIHKWVPLIRDAMISGFHALNCRNIQELHLKLRSGKLRFEKRASGAFKESGINVEM
ncbi:IMP dehydrogenase [Candidatus Woesearchaeota archaeon]|nr:IMP dehydrogenase [Candidatus Woesearchaeota archaeon]